MRLLRNVSDPLGQNGLVNLPPAYVVKSHPNPIPHQVRHGAPCLGAMRVRHLALELPRLCCSILSFPVKLQRAECMEDRWRLFCASGGSPAEI